MSDQTPSPKKAPSAPAPATPEYRVAQRWNIVWVVPILAVLIGGWLIYHNLSAKGPVVTITFETAEGIAAGKTEIRCRSVRVGVVREVRLSDDLKSVNVHAEIDPEAKDLLRNGSRFWVVRPRVSTTDISGLGTLITGAFIELDPGKGQGEGEITTYTGLESPPSTSLSIPGRRLILEAEEAGSLVSGSPIYFRGLEVGRIESRELDPQGLKVNYGAYIKEEYSHLIRENSRFWNTSGIDVTAGADGFKLRTPSFQAMFAGGAVFGVPDDVPPGPPAVDGTRFVLYSSENNARRSNFNPTEQFLLLFDQTVRGLSKGSPVEYRGIPVGRVADISFNYSSDNPNGRIPVLILIDPSLLRRETADRVSQPDAEFLKSAVASGLRATLKTGSLLTGALFVDLDYYPDSPKADLTKTGDLLTLPTISTGLAQLEEKVTAILEKIEALPIEDTMKRFSIAADTSNATLKEIEATAASARRILDDPQFQNLPSDLRGTLAEVQKSVSSVGPNSAIQGDLLRTLDELRSALRAFESVTTTIDDKPNSLLFGRDSSGNPIPRAPKR